MSQAVTFSHVTKMFKDKIALGDLSFTIERGQVVSLLGPNGAGKTTAISLMLGLSRPTSGSVSLFGENPTHPRNRRQIGAMLQQVNLPPGLTVAQTIQLFRSYYPNPLPVRQLLEYAALEKEANVLATKLSGGQNRRLQYALAMAGNPELLFLDEPTTAMDVTSRRTFWEGLREFASRQGKTVILTTHHLEEADAISDRILLIQSGRLIADGSSADIKSMAGHRYVSFTGGPNFHSQQLSTLSHAETVEQGGRRVRIRTKDSDGLLRALIRMELDISDFEVTGGALEDAFVALTEHTEDRRVM